MAEIPKNCIHRLRTAGLFVSTPGPKDHVWPEFVLIGKPKDVQGNVIPGYSTSYFLDIESDKRIDFDAPPVRLWFDGEIWIVLAEEYCPGPGPGDFLDEWTTPEDAVDDVLDFYFGDPKRMQAKAEARKHPLRSPQTPEDKRKSASA